MYTSLILLIIILVPIPVMMKYMLAGNHAYRCIREGAMTTVLGVMLTFMFVSVFTGVSLFERIDWIYSQISINDLALTPGYASFGLNQLEPEQLERIFTATKEYIKLAIPGAAVVMTILSAYLNYLWLSFALRKMGKQVHLLPPFKTFSLPKNVLLGAIIVYALAYLAGSMEIVDQRLLMVNVEIIFGFLFSVQGLAFIFFFGNLRRIPKALLVLISAIFILTTFGHTVLFMTGLVDIAFDMRKRFSQNSLMK